MTPGTSARGARFWFGRLGPNTTQQPYRLMMALMMKIAKRALGRGLIGWPSFMKWMRGSRGPTKAIKIVAAAKTNMGGDKPKAPRVKRSSPVVWKANKNCDCGCGC